MNAILRSVAVAFESRIRASVWAAGLSLLLAYGVCAEPQKPAGLVAAGTPAETPWYVRKGAAPGPTVVIVGGIHGNEPAGAEAAGQIRHWPIVRGTMVVLSRANVVAFDANRRSFIDDEGAHKDLNRNFPTADLPSPRGSLAAAIWDFVRGRRPDWVIDLHEGYDVHATNSASVGSSVIAASAPEARAAATALWERVNGTITNDRIHFRLLGPPVTGSLARASHDALGARSMILETTSRNQPLSRRVRQHRVMVHALLERLEMIDGAVTPDRLAPPPDGRPRIALFDAEGTGGSGPGRITDIAEQHHNALVIRVGPDDIRGGALAAFDAVVFPGGSGSRQAAALGEAGRAAVCDFVDRGGGYLGVCAGAYLALSGYSWGLGVVDGRTASSLWRRGRGHVPVEFTEAGRTVLGATASTQSVLYANGPILAPPPDGSAPYEVLAMFRGEVAENGSPVGVMVDSPAIAAARFGKGRVIWCSPHPEQVEDLEHTVAGALRWLTETRVSSSGLSVTRSPPRPRPSGPLDSTPQRAGAGANEP